tara:strand:+ start:697 stop:1098 length:402 start_codon:yes stop_codon:yes gene_type:complete
LEAGEKMENALWFFFGIIVANLISRLASFVRGYVMVRQVEADCLSLLNSAAHDMSFVKNMRKNALEGLVLTANQIKIQNNLDEYSFKTWKQLAINNFIANYPDKFRRLLSFNDWDGAMKHLQLLKEERNKQKS